MDYNDSSTCVRRRLPGLLGLSIHSHYTFETDRAINAHFQTGKLTWEESDLLEKGDVKEIVPGSEYIDSLFHLD